jgi:hypothetical protein
VEAKPGGGRALLVRLVNRASTHRWRSRKESRERYRVSHAVYVIPETRDRGIFPYLQNMVIVPARFHLADDTTLAVTAKP